MESPWAVLESSVTASGTVVAVGCNRLYIGRVAGLQLLSANHWKEHGEVVVDVVVVVVDDDDDDDDGDGPFLESQRRQRVSESPHGAGVAVGISATVRVAVGMVAVGTVCQRDVFMAQLTGPNMEKKRRGRTWQMPDWLSGIREWDDSQQPKYGNHSREVRNWSELF